MSIEGTGNQGQLQGAPFGVGEALSGNLFAPEHREVGGNHLVFPREIEPDLEELGGVGSVGVDEREGLGMDHPFAGGHPLDIALTKAGPGTQGVMVVDIALASEGNGFKSPVGMLGESGDPISVVHTPSILAVEVVPNISASEKSGVGPHVFRAFGVGVEVMNAEKKRIGGLPGKTKGGDAFDRAHKIKSGMKRKEGGLFGWRT